MPILNKSNIFLELYFPVLLAIFMVACNSSFDNNKKLPNPDKTAIEVYAASIHSIILPFRDSCYDSVAVQKVTIPDSLSKFTSYGQLIGKVNVTNHYIAILYSIPADIQLPVLYTFNTKGEVISSLKLFIGNCCGENEDCSGVSTVQITNDLHILLKDSTQTFERDKRKYTKKQNIQLRKKYEEFKIDSVGRIISLPH